MTKLGWLLGAGLFLGCATASPPSQAPGAAAPNATAQSAQSTPNADGTQNKDGAKVASAKKDPKKELICESYKVTGSHLRKQICRTKAQMAADRAQAEKLLQEGDRFRPGEGN